MIISARKQSGLVLYSSDIGTKTKPRIFLHLFGFKKQKYEQNKNFKDKAIIVHNRLCVLFLKHSKTVKVFTYGIFAHFTINNIGGNKRRTYLELDVWIPSLNIGFEYQVCVLLNGQISCDGLFFKIWKFDGSNINYCVLCATIF